MTTVRCCALSAVVLVTCLPHRWPLHHRHSPPHVNPLQDALLAALQQCIAYTDSTVLQVGQQICLPPWEAACTYVSNSAGIDTCKIYQARLGKRPCCWLLRRSCSRW